ncbi:MAG: serine/threonine-protein kinase, partial [Pirellulaceae bacterium]
LVQLRSIELSLFWASAALLAWHQYLVVLSLAEQGNATLALAAIKSHILYFLCIMVPYGLLIPNSWRRTALIVMPVAIAPVAVSLVLGLRHEAVAQVADQIATPAQITDHLFVMIIGAACAVYGSYVVNTLRREAFEAKKLGQYRLRELIGTGGMGEVYRAEHQLMKRQCAIKLIRPGIATDPLALARFEREVQAAARLTHWNSVEVYDYGRTDDGTFYYVMELLPGLSLADIVDRYGPMPSARVVHLMDQTCNALREAHSAGLVHRDIKPSNIFAAQRGGVYDVAKLLDFGLVRPLVESHSTQLTQEGAITGSPLYMSPEQAEGQLKADARSDIYSLGAVAYYLLTGRPPFDASSPVKILIAHARDEVVPPSRHRPEVASDLEQVVMRCLAKGPDARFDDARSLQQAIADCEVKGCWSQDDANQWWQQVEQEPLRVSVSP